MTSKTFTVASHTEAHEALRHFVRERATADVGVALESLKEAIEAETWQEAHELAVEIAHALGDVVHLEREASQLPPAPEVQVSLSGQVLLERNGDDHQLSLLFGYDGVLHPTDYEAIAAQELVRAFVAVMNGVRSVGGPVVGGVQAPNWGGRTFELGPYTDGETSTVSIDDVDLAQVTAGEIVFTLAVDAGSDNATLMSEWFQSQTVTLAVRES